MKLACKELDSAIGCDFVVTGETAEEVAEKMTDHAKMEHPEAIKGMSDSEIMAMFEDKAHE